MPRFSPGVLSNKIILKTIGYIEVLSQRTLIRVRVRVGLGLGLVPVFYNDSIACCPV